MNNIPDGYKQTEVGVIPEDWEVLSIDDLCSYQNGRALEQYFNDRDGYLVISIGNYSLFGKFVETGKYVSRDYTKKLKTYLLQENDLAMLLNDKTSAGAIIGRVLLVDRDDTYIFNQRTMKLTCKQVVKPSFLYFQINCDTTHRRIVDLAKPGTQIYLNTNDINQLKVPLPPTKAEQEAIAEALSDADALIESLEKLIAKKRQIKQGAMQKLLTGKKRLPGFSGEWEVMPLGELFEFSGGFSASRDQLTSEGYCYLHYGDIHLSKKTFIDVRFEYREIPKLDIPLKRISPGSMLNDGDVVFVDASEDEEGTSRHVVILNPDGIPFISGLHTIVAKGKNKLLEHQYRRYCFQTTAVKSQFRFFAVGTKVSGISKTNIAKVTLSVPSIPEQAAIAAILSDMDAEIAALEKKLNKARRIKQGMMQELLTGRIRLV